MTVFEPTSAVLNRGDRGLYGKSSDTIKIAFMGGSVTYGYLPTSEDSKVDVTFCDIIIKHLHELFPDKRIEHKSLAVSGEGCMLGLMIECREIKAFKPDIVVVEYAINEDRSSGGLARFEGLIRRLIYEECSPVVLPIAVFNRSGYSCEDYMLEIAKHYGLYFCGLKSTLYPLIIQGELAWEYYSPDDGHPSENGHKLIGEAACAALDMIVKTEYKPIIPIKAKFGGDKFDTLHEITSNGQLFGFEKLDKDFYGVNCALKSSGNAIYRFSTSCKFIAACYICSNCSSLGDAEVFIDGVKLKTLQGYSIFGWENPVTSVLLDEARTKQRDIEIKTSGEFYLAGIWIS